MEISFADYLHAEGLSEEAVAVLTQEEIISLEVFHALKQEHFTRLLPKLKVGQHALLLKLHRDCEVSCLSCYILYDCNQYFYTCSQCQTHFCLPKVCS